jgi:oxalate decarboxylase
MAQLSRRNMLAATAAGSVLAAATQAGAAQVKGELSTSDPGPSNPAVAAQDPNQFAPPPTDHGNLGTLKYSFSNAHNRRTEAGWAREVTVRNFPIAKSIAGVNMRLQAGAVRELHWHLPAEWAYMLYGTARITAVDAAGRKFVADVKEGDLWFFPSGIPHSIQGLGSDGCEFLLAFDDGNFSEDSTLLITDWFTHTPKDVLAKNFGVDAATFAKVPPRELYIFNAPMPGALQGDLTQTTQQSVPEPFNFSLLSMPPIRTKGGTVRIADSSNFKAAKTIAAALVEVEPGGMRELHWHPNADEWSYFISGKARVTMFVGEGRANTVDFAVSDVGYIPRSMGHYVENIGDTTLRFLEIFASDHYADISLTNWIANTPHELVAAHLNVDEAVLKALPINKVPVLPA